MQPINYRRAVKIKAKEVFKANCAGKKFSDIDYSDGIIAKIYGKDPQDVWNEIEYFANVYHENLAFKNMEAVAETTKAFFDSCRKVI